MTEQTNAEEYGDALTRPFWAGATRGELLIQRCEACGHHQFYPRPFCLVCYSDEVKWVGAVGTATVYSQTTVHVSGEPYNVAVVQLDEGPRMTTSIVGEPVAIGDPVRVRWQEREGLPPLPVFVRRSGSTQQG